MRKSLITLAYVWCLLGPFPANAAPDLDSAGLNGILAGLESRSGGNRVAALIADPQSMAILYHYNPDYILRRFFPPGSLMKPLSAAVLLETPGFNPGRKIICSGHYPIPAGLLERRDRLLFPIVAVNGREAFRCGVQAGHGAVDLRQALVRSCNVYFLTMAAAHPGLYPTLRERWHLSEATGAIGLGQERPSLAPPPGDLSAFGRLAATIGEGGAVRLSPLKIAQAYGALFAGGPLKRPGGQFPPTFARDTLRKIAAILGEVPRSGTLSGLKLNGGAGALLAGKTGTATHFRKKYANHGWNAIYFEHAKRRLLLVVFVENGSGPKEARDISAAILRNLGI